MSALWNTAAHGPVRSRLIAWAVIVALFYLSSFIPDPAGFGLRVGLMAVAFALVAAFLAPHQSRRWQIATRVTLGAVLVYATIAALLT